MGVIKKQDCSFGITSSISEETLYIPSSDDEGHLVQSTEHLPSTARTLRAGRHRIPTINRGTYNSISSQPGKKKSRRYQNVTQLMTLAEEDEFDEVTIQDFVKSTKTAFTKLLEDENSFKKWDEFVSCDEEAQKQFINQQRKQSSQKSENVQRKVDTVLKGLLKKKNLPLGMLKYLEDELITFFSTMPTDIYISPALSSFERLLLHSLSDFHRLISLSFDSNKMRLVRVSNPKEEFPSPQLLLVQYVESKYLKN